MTSSYVLRYPDGTKAGYLRQVPGWPSDWKGLKYDAYRFRTKEAAETAADKWREYLFGKRSEYPLVVEIKT